MAWNKEEDLKLKYAYIDGESNPRYKKKAKKKTVRKADHKHEWNNCNIHTFYPHNYSNPNLARTEVIIHASYCPICGKVNESIQEDQEFIAHAPDNLKPRYGLFWGIYIRKPNAKTEIDEFWNWYESYYPHFIFYNWFNTNLGDMYIDLESDKNADAG